MNIAATRRRRSARSQVVTVLIELELANALGIRRQSPPGIVAAALVKTGAGITVADNQIPEEVSFWLLSVAKELGEHLNFDNRFGGNVAKVAAEVALDQAGRLPKYAAPGALALVAPHHLAPSGVAFGDLPDACRKVLRQHLEAFCVAVLASWEAQVR